MQTVRLLLVQQQSYDARRTKDIGNARSHSHSRNSHPEDQYKQQVKQRIEYAGHHQNVQRTPCVAHAAQDGRPKLYTMMKGMARK